MRVREASCASASVRLSGAPALTGDFSGGSLGVRAASRIPGSHKCDVGVLAGGVSLPARWPRLSLLQRSALFVSSGSLEGHAVPVLPCSQERALGCLSVGWPLPGAVASLPS